MLNVMSKDITQRAVTMLLNGATLLSQPCPYCMGVRVIKDGHALCASCGKEPEKRNVPPPPPPPQNITQLLPRLLDIINKKIATLSVELEQTDDHTKQQEILKSINMHLDTLAKINETFKDKK